MVAISPTGVSFQSKYLIPSCFLVGIFSIRDPGKPVTAFPSFLLSLEIMDDSPAVGFFVFSLQL